MRRLGLNIAALVLAPAALSVALAVPAAAQFAGPFMLFFDRGSAEVSPSGRAILDNAVEAYRAGEKQRQVMIDGHADLSVDAETAVRESQMRANNARDYLVSQGVPSSVITTQAWGNTRPLVETEDGVAEPQNRRVEITFGPGGGW